MNRICLSRVSRSALVAVSLSTAMFAHPALAAEGDAANDAGSDAEKNRVDEIIVTAQRVEADLQDTPISVTALSEEQLYQFNVHDPQVLRGLVPNLEILPSSGGGAGVFGRNQTSVTIRGVGGSDRFFAQDTKVGVYIDDVYLSTTYTMNLGFYDIDNVQVLRGPQGTLFGKNTIGGALLIQTREPEGELSAEGRFTFGSYDRIEAQGAINVPLSDTLAARISFYSSDVDGYIEHLLDDRESNDAHEKSIRGQLRFEPNDRLTIDLKAEYGASHDNGNAYIITQINPNASYVRNYNSVNAVPYQTAYAPLGLPFTIYGDTLSDFAYSPRPYPQFRPFNEGENATVQLRAALELDESLTLKSITGYKNISLDSYRADGTPGGLYTEYNEFRVRQISQELQVLGTYFDDRLNFVAGLFYIKQDATSTQITGPDYVDPVGYYYYNDNDFPSWAAYAQVTFRPIEGLRLTAGLRYTNDEKNTATNIWTSGCLRISYAQSLATGTGGCWVPGPDINTLSRATKSWSHVDPRFEVDYEWLPNLMTYVTVGSGYQSGGFNTQNGPGIPANIPYDQEIVWSYEAGLKSEWFDHRLRMNAAIFRQDYKNYQSSVLVYYNGVDTRTISSAANARQKGFEFELDARPVDPLGLRFTYAHLDQGFTEIFPGAQGLTLETAISTAPRNEWSLAGDLTIPLPQGRLVAAADYRWVGTKASGTAPAITYTPPYDLLGANVTYTPDNDRWSLSFWAKNVMDEYYYAAYSNRLNNGIGLTTVTPGMPRQIGVTFAVKVR